MFTKHIVSMQDFVSNCDSIMQCLHLFCVNIIKPLVQITRFLKNQWIITQIHQKLYFIRLEMQKSLLLTTFIKPPNCRWWINYSDLWMNFFGKLKIGHWDVTRTRSARTTTVQSVLNKSKSTTSKIYGYEFGGPTRWLNTYGYFPTCSGNLQLIDVW